MNRLERWRYGLPVKTHGKGGVVKDQQRHASESFLIGQYLLNAIPFLLFLFAQTWLYLNVIVELQMEQLLTI